MPSARIHITITHGVDGGAKVYVDFLDITPGMDAIAAIRALVDRTAELTRLTPERVLGMVEKAAYTRSIALIAGREPRPPVSR